MNRNTIIAFALILGALFFFRTPAYYKMYEKVTGREHSEVIRQRKMAENARKNVEKNAENKNTPKKNVSIEPIKGAAPSQVNTSPIGEDRDTLSNSDTVDFDTIWVETESVICGISEMGGRIISLQTKEYKYRGTEKFVELLEDKVAGGCNLIMDGVDYDRRVFAFDGSNKNIQVENGNSSVVTLSLVQEDGQILRKEFSFKSNGYRIGFSVTGSNMSGRNISVGWLGGISESEMGSGGRTMQGVFRKLHIFDGESITHVAYKKARKESERGDYYWLGLTSKYFLVALGGVHVLPADIEYESYKMNMPETKKKSPRGMNINYRFRSRRTGNSEGDQYWIYAGPSKLTELKKYDSKLQKVLFSGWRWFLWADTWFPAVCEFVLWLLIKLQLVVKDYGIVIIILTVLLRLVTFPLTQSSMKSMKKMKEIQPKLTAIREKYSKNAQKMNEKIMALYKKEGVNPLNPGCLPMFLQMPVLFSLFIVLRKAIELRGQGTFLVPWVHDLSQPEALPVISDWLTKVSPGGLPMYGNTVGLLPIVMAILTFFQNKATIKDPNQKAMIYFMPIFMLVLFNSFPSGLVLYWTFSSALQIVQQKMMDSSKKL